MRNYRVIATDLDGTLLDPRHLLTERNREALLAARAHGITVVAVTARTPRGLHLVPGLPETVDFAICNNGAVLYEPATGAIDVRRTIPAPAVAELHARARHAIPDALFTIETGTAIYAEGTDPVARSHYGDPWTDVAALEDVLADLDGVVEYRVQHRDMDGPSMRAALDRIPTPGMVRWAWGSFPVLEYNADTVNKGDALAAWCAERGFAADDVVAFGDMPNDVSMLAWAGRSYAMAGAPSEVVEAAGFAAASNREDGVARAVEDLLPEPVRTD
ncbi:HAD hydrolase family protein [Glycomyces sp. NPDC047010]|uniref:HAD hydrolase family protein n=1 Tax=Glycomyces sp. NPDC047010 TaxID=3155023 RepID=UPI0033D51EAD